MSFKDATQIAAEPEPEDATELYIMVDSKYLIHVQAWPKEKKRGWSEKLAKHYSEIKAEFQRLYALSNNQTKKGLAILTMNTTATDPMDALTFDHIFKFSLHDAETRTVINQCVEKLKAFLSTGEWYIDDSTIRIVGMG